MKLAIIGSGNMGGAIALGLAKSCIIKASDICCADKSASVLQKILAAEKDINTTADNLVAIANADIVTLAVKPWLVETVINEIKPALDYGRQTVISIAAGVDFKQLTDYLQKDDGSLPPLFRIIPNTAIEQRQSVNFVAALNADAKHTDLIIKLFSELGLTLQVSEALLKSGTALASCGIAYAFRYIRAAVEGAVELGFYPAQAQQVVMQTLKGAVALLEANGSHPETEIDKVTTPGGITIKGLNAMEEQGFTNAVIKGLKASAL